MKKNKKNHDRWQGYTPADCDCKYCVFYGGKERRHYLSYRQLRLCR